MGKKRMFNTDITDSDKFMDMPVSAQNLYFHLGMHGDDDGFVSAPKRIMRSAGSSESDLQTLISEDFIIPFESGVVVITDWKINNNLRNDRYKPTIYKEEKSHLTTDEIGRYTIGIPSDNQWCTDGMRNITEQSIAEQSIAKQSTTEQGIRDKEERENGLTLTSQPQHTIPFQTDLEFEEKRREKLEAFNKALEEREKEKQNGLGAI